MSLSLLMKLIKYMNNAVICLQSILIYGWEGKAMSERDSERRERSCRCREKILKNRSILGFAFSCRFSVVRVVAPCLNRLRSCMQLHHTIPPYQLYSFFKTVIIRMQCQKEI